MTKNIKTFIYTAAAITVSAGALMSLTPNIVVAAPEANKTQEHKAFIGSKDTIANKEIFANLTGFKPGMIVTYKIIDDGKIVPLSGTAQTDEHGNLIIPMTENLLSASSEVKYNFIIDDENDTLNLVLIHNLENNALSIEGSGTNKFTKIVIESQENLHETRSDWAGLFEDEIENFHQKQPKEKSSYKIAFFNAAPGQDVNDLVKRPTIEVQYSPNGGGPTSAGVNSYSAGNCGTGPTPSYCDTGLMNSLEADFVDHFVEPMQMFAEQLTYNAMHQAFIIGTFFDAKETLEIQRDYQVLKAEAHRNYHTSEQLCRIASFTKSLANTSQKKDHDTAAMNEIMMAYLTNEYNTMSGFGPGYEYASRIENFRTKYCNPMDNGGGLSYLCEHDQNNDLSDSPYRTAAPGGTGASDLQRMNKDIDYFRAMDRKLTIDVDFTDDTLTEDEEDVIALAKNLYWPTPYDNPTDTVIDNNVSGVMKARTMIALHNIAHMSFAHQVGMKSKAPTHADPEKAGWAHIKTMMRDFGISDTEIVTMLGESPSYYAQMEMLTKKLYQNPDFYTNLYDKPANVDRMLASMEAISLMQMRDHYQTMMRQEMLTSALLSGELMPVVEKAQGALSKSRSSENY